MKKVLLSVLFFVCLNFAEAQFGFFASAAYIHANDTTQFYNTYDQQPDASAIGTINFQGAELGTYVQNSDSLFILGGQVKTYKNTNGDVCSVDIYYTVYPIGNRPANAVFTKIATSFYDNCSDATFPTGGPCGPGDQKWQEIGQNMDLTTFAPGTYTIEIYYQVNGTNDANCGDAIAYDNNNSSTTNYSATFTITSTTPVVLQSFTAIHNTGAVLLKWIDNNEINNKGFEIQRSSDGKSFSDLAWQASGGNSSANNTYTYTDNHLPNVTEVFYRLKIIDNDGSIKYSFVIPVNLSQLSVPITAQLNGDNLSVHISGLTQGSYLMQVYGIDGRFVNSKSLKITSANTGQSLLLSLNNLAKGVYTISLRNAAGALVSKASFIK